MQEGNLYNEPELLRRVAGGSEEAFRELFHAYRRKIFSYLIKVTGSQDLAEDLLQEVFMNLWSIRARLPEIENLNAYLHRMAHSQAYHGLKSAAKELLVKDHLKNQTEESGENDPGQKLLSQEVQALIQHLADQLSPAQRKVFLLTRTQNLTPNEVAGQLGLTPNTVRKHLRDAIAFIRGELGRSYGAKAIALYVLFRLGMP